ncbi:hypothetical protein EDD18DRAFT_1336508 [Armillaria luteobubalina]|uniref:Uncharacterized protein n=1 Tax=Armillaria luteobubalina TaxID=153913 RepID=A0AA39UB77_9AGAR|nr:hypothetical protein EDD18DRAFT_1336508 [Armillaria luteobubalina]
MQESVLISATASIACIYLVQSTIEDRDKDLKEKVIYVMHADYVTHRNAKRSSTKCNCLLWKHMREKANANADVEMQTNASTHVGHAEFYVPPWIWTYQKLRSTMIQDMKRLRRLKYQEQEEEGEGGSEKKDDGTEAVTFMMYGSVQADGGTQVVDEMSECGKHILRMDVLEIIKEDDGLDMHNAQFEGDFTGEGGDGRGAESSTRSAASGLFGTQTSSVIEYSFCTLDPRMRRNPISNKSLIIASFGVGTGHSYPFVGVITLQIVIGHPRMRHCPQELDSDMVPPDFHTDPTPTEGQSIVVTYKSKTVPVHTSPDTGTDNPVWHHPICIQIPYAPTGKVLLSLLVELACHDVSVHVEVVQVAADVSVGSAEVIVFSGKILTHTVYRSLLLQGPVLAQRGKEPAVHIPKWT